MTTGGALAFVERNGVALQAGHGPVPNLAEAVAGERIRGSWWSHSRGREIFRIFRAMDSSADVLVCKLVDGKITYVHRRLWPALMCLRNLLPRSRLARVWNEHTSAGAHAARREAFPKWVPPGVFREAAALTVEEAKRMLPAGLIGIGVRQRLRRK